MFGSFHHRKGLLRQSNSAAFVTITRRGRTYLFVDQFVRGTYRRKSVIHAVRGYCARAAVLPLYPSRYLFNH